MSQYGIARGFVVSGRTMSEPVYFPKHTKNGKEINQKVLVTIAVNRRGFKNAETGVIGEKTPVKIQVGAWNSLADVIARGCATGQELSFEMEIESFPAVVKIPQAQQDGSVKYVPVMKADGSGFFTDDKMGFCIIAGTLRFGRDSQKAIDNEVGKGTRPVGWNGAVTIGMIEAAQAGGTLEQFIIQAKNGADAWQAVLLAKNKQEYTGGPTFGYAKVIKPAGDIKLAYPIDKAVGGTESGTAVKVDGFTYEAMITAGWSDEQLLTAEGGKWASLVPRKAPAPPASTPVPPPPGLEKAVGQAVKSEKDRAEEMQAKINEMTGESFDEEILDGTEIIETASDEDIDAEAGVTRLPQKIVAARDDDDDIPF